MALLFPAEIHADLRASIKEYRSLERQEERQERYGKMLILYGPNPMKESLGRHLTRIGRLQAIFMHLRVLSAELDAHGVSTMRCGAQISGIMSGRNEAAAEICRLRWTAVKAALGFDVRDEAEMRLNHALAVGFREPEA